MVDLPPGPPQCVAAARSQTIERQAIVPGGASAVLPGGSISWTIGQVASTRGDPGSANLTRGFQQPYFQYGRLVAEDFSGSAGDTRGMRVTLALSGGENPAATAIRLKLRFNSTLLQPIGSTAGATMLSDSMSNGRRTVEMLLPIQPFTPSPITLTTLNFKVGLGDDSASALELLEAVPVGGPVRLQSIGGRFTLLGICREGAPRLVSPVRRAAIAFKPNPVASLADVEFDIHDRLRARIALVDMYGHEIRTYVDDELDAGHYSVACDMSSVPSGAYTLVLNASWERITRTLVVQH